MVYQFPVGEMKSFLKAESFLAIQSFNAEETLYVSLFSMMGMKCKGRLHEV